MSIEEDLKILERRASMREGQLALAELDRLREQLGRPTRAELRRLESRRAELAEEARLQAEGNRRARERYEAHQAAALAAPPREEAVLIGVVRREIEDYRRQEADRERRTSALLARRRALESPRRLPRVRGYAAVFDAPYYRSCIDGLEVIRRGAFAPWLRSGQSVVALVNHDEGRRLGSTASGALRLREDSYGLLAILDPRGPEGERLVEALREGRCLGMSFHGRAARDRRGAEVYEVLEFELVEVTYALDKMPANPRTSAHLVE